MSNRVAVFNQPHRADRRTLHYEHPATAFCCGFVGVSNVCTGDSRAVSPDRRRRLRFARKIS